MKFLEVLNIHPSFVPPSIFKVDHVSLRSKSQWKMSESQVFRLFINPLLQTQTHTQQ